MKNQLNKRENRKITQFATKIIPRVHNIFVFSFCLQLVARKVLDTVGGELSGEQVFFMKAYSFSLPHQHLSLLKTAETHCYYPSSR